MFRKINLMNLKKVRKDHAEQNNNNNKVTFKSSISLFSNLKLATSCNVFYYFDKNDSLSETIKPPRRIFLRVRTFL